MEYLTTTLLTIAVSAGQIIKFPIDGRTGPVLLDLVILFLNLFALIKAKFKLSKPNLPFTILFLFNLSAFLSLLLNPLNLSLQQFLISLSYLMRLLNYSIFTYFISTHKLSINLPNFVIQSSVILSILGFAQLIFFPDLSPLSALGWDPHYYRLVSTFLDPNLLGAFLVIGLLFSYLSIKNKLRFTLTFGLIFLAISLTFSRSSYLMFLVSFSLLGLLEKNLKLTLISITLFLVFLGIFQLNSIYIAAPRNIDRTQSAISRLSTWQQGIQIFKSNPILGVGFNAYRYGLERYSLIDPSSLASRGATTNDSSLLYILATTGLLGFSLFLFFFISTVYTSIKRLAEHSIYPKLILSMILGLLANSIFNNSLFYPPIFLVLLLTIATLSKSIKLFHS